MRWFGGEEGGQDKEVWEREGGCDEVVGEGEGGGD